MRGRVVSLESEARELERRTLREEDLQGGRKDCQPKLALMSRTNSPIQRT